jgi:hypothetical protein
MTPPEYHPGQQAYTFLIRILSTSFISVSIFYVCCYSRVSRIYLKGRTFQRLRLHNDPVLYDASVRIAQRRRVRRQNSKHRIKIKLDRLRWEKWERNLGEFFL